MKNMRKRKTENNSFRQLLASSFPEPLTSGNLIRAKRQNYGITLKEVSDATGISESNLSQYENDRKPIGFLQATKIGLAVGLNPMTILVPNGIETDSRFLSVAKKSKKLLDKKMPLPKLDKAS